MKKKTNMSRAGRFATPTKDKKKLETIKVIADARLEDVTGGVAVAAPCCCGVCK